MDHAARWRPFLNRLLPEAADFSGPLYVYDLDAVAERAGRVNCAFPDFGLLYSLKANPHPAIVALLAAKGAGADTASANETRLAASQGVPAGKIYYSSPGKTRADLCAAWGKCTIIADSVNELALLDALAAERGEAAEAGVRLNVPNGLISRSAHEIMGGMATKFGMAPEDFAALGRGRFPHLKIAGVHVYFGSQLLDPDILYNNFRLTAAAALSLAGSGHCPPKFVNFGGGFGVPQRPGEKELDLEALSGRVHADPDVRALLDAKTVCNLELGRYLAAESGLYVTKVADVKESYGKKYAILDGGMNTFYRPIMTGDFHGVLQPGNDRDFEPVTLVGNLCTPIDQYYADIPLRRPSPGDLIAFVNAGAYGYTMSLLEFISREKPREIAVGGNTQTNGDLM